MTWYCNLAEAKFEINAANSADDDKLGLNIQQVSARIDQIMNPGKMRPYFAPYIEERQFPVYPMYVSSLNNTFDMASWLLAFTTVELDGSDITTTSEKWPSLARAFHYLKRTSYSYSWYQRSDCNSYPSFVNVTGTWGYHGDYPNAWVAIDTLGANLAIGGVTLTVTDIDGADPFGFSPRLSVGSLLKINSDFVEVTGNISTAANTCTIRRSVNGATAAAHTLGDTVYAWYTDPLVRRITARQAGLLYNRRGAYQVENIDGIGVISYPQDLLTELKHTLSEYAYGGF